MTEKSSYLPGEPTWVDLATPNMDVTNRFYEGLLGWTAGEQSGEEFGGYAIFTKDGKKVAGVVPLMFEGQPAVWSCYVSTDDAEKTAAKVTEAGGTLHAPPMAVADLGSMAICMDPGGAYFGIWQPGEHTGAELVGVEGTMSWIELATRDQKTALPFYASVFGWDAHVGDGYTEFQLGGRSVAGCMDMPPMVPAEVGAYWMPYFAAEDPAAQAEKAVSLGGSVLVPYMEMAEVAFSVVRDPHGSAFGLLKLKV